MSEEDRKEMKRAFEHALKLIKSGERDFICVALGEGFPAAKALIMHRLGDHFTLGRWLVEVAGIPRHWVFGAGGHKKQRATRIAWLESLIKEFS